MSTRKLDLSIEINASPDLVWEAISKGEEITKWFAPDARVTPGEGGSVWLSWGPGMEGESKIIGWEPGHRLATLEGEARGQPKTIEYIIETKDGRTTLRLVHSGFGEGASFDAEYESTNGGWLTFLAMLKYGVERFPRVPARNVTFLRMLPDSVADSWATLTDGLSLKRDGDRFTANLDGQALEGSVVRFVKDGYLCLSADTLDGALVSLFVENCGGAAVFTVMNILYGDSAKRGDEIHARWTALTDRLFTAPQSAGA